MKEAPVLRPTIEQFSDPMKFIESIKDEVAQYGICRIVPPPEWDRDCIHKNINFDKYIFSTKCQKIDQLCNRRGPSVQFTDELKQFWSNVKKQPITQMPMVDSRPLDLYLLFFLVEKRGGYIEVCKNKLWKEIGDELRISKHYKNAPSAIQKNYLKYIEPYIKYLYYNPSERHKYPFTSKQTTKVEDSPYNTRFRKSLIVSPDVQSNKKRKRVDDIKNNNGGTTPKRVSPSTTSSWKDVHLRYFINQNENNDYKCSYCSSSNKDKLLKCKSCQYRYAHADCISQETEKSTSWICDRCVNSNGSDINIEWTYGYEEGKRYILNEYKKMADRFFESWFQGYDHTPSYKEIEKEYWDIIEKSDKQVHVHYGSDLDVRDHGSGFPYDLKKKTPETNVWKNALSHKKKMNPQWRDKNIELMKNSGWNLNNLPFVSVLKHLNQSIAGVTRPMIYIGMLFSTFCWHTEDNWLYSINYVHSGASKLWYGIPGSSAVDFEKAMRAEFPNLFESEPNLLYLLVTMISPEKLKEYNVPVYTTIQNEGEFIITFPRSYHAGFNTGFNIAESVNFAAYDWIPWGYLSSQSYRCERSSVFPIEELLVNIAKDAKTIKDPNVLNSALIELKKVVEESKNFIDEIKSKGIKLKQRAKSKKDCNQCEACGYDCYLFEVYCDSHPEQSFCLHHYNHTCQCKSPHKRVEYLYTLAQLQDHIDTLNDQLETLPITT